MKLTPSVPLSRPVAVLVAAFAAVASPLALLFGVAELIRPDVGPEFLVQNAAICSALILFGLALAAWAIGACRAAFVARRGDAVPASGATD